MLKYPIFVKRDMWSHFGTRLQTEFPSVEGRPTCTLRADICTAVTPFPDFRLEVGTSGLGTETVSGIFTLLWAVPVCEHLDPGDRWNFTHMARYAVHPACQNGDVLGDGLSEYAQRYFLRAEDSSRPAARNTDEVVPPSENPLIRRNPHTLSSKRKYPRPTPGTADKSAAYQVLPLPLGDPGLHKSPNTPNKHQKTKSLGPLFQA